MIKAISFDFRKIAFSGRQKNDFFMFPKNWFRRAPWIKWLFVSEKSLFQGTMKKIAIPDKSFFLAQRITIFSVPEKWILQGAKKEAIFSFPEKLLL